MSYNLFLDDFRLPEMAFNITHNPVYNKLEWVLVKSYDEFVEYVTEHGLPDLVSFDHDLADVHYDVADPSDADYDSFAEKTGNHCVKWMVKYCMDNDLDFPSFLLHSDNVVGRENMLSYITNFIKFKEDE